MIDEKDERWLASEISRLAALHLTARFGRVGAAVKADGSLLTEADTAMQAAVGAVLAERYPLVPLLAEEQPPEVQQALMAEAETGVWCLDPLDGTTNFAAGMPLFAVSLAFIGRGEVELGLVHDPLRGETFTARRGTGARLNGRPLPCTDTSLGPAGMTSRLNDSVAVVDFKRLPPDLAGRLAVTPPFRSQRSLGSVALDWCWLAAQRFQLYLHGGQRLWDYAAGQLIAREAGAAVCLAGVPGEGPCGLGLSLAPRVAMGATDAVLLAQWRRWLAGG